MLLRGVTGTLGRFAATRGILAESPKLDTRRFLRCCPIPARPAVSADPAGIQPAHIEAVPGDRVPVR
jgi:hypothetical protein